MKASTIALVGMPGGGKSTIGRQLARRLHLPFVDSDAEIERRIGMPIREYFAAHGEAAFRDVEQAVLETVLCADAAKVVATGGGAPLREANRELLRRAATVIYLRSTPEDLYRRLRHDTQRPLLQVADPQKRLREMHQERDPLYRRCAHFIIDTGRPSVSTLVNMIIMQLELAGLLPRPIRQPDPVGGADAPPTLEP